MVKKKRSKLEQGWERWLYNAYDCCITRELRDVLASDLDPISQRVYECERTIQAAFFHVGQRGIRVDQGALRAMRKELQAKVEETGREIDRLSEQELRGPKGAPVPQRLNKFFYSYLGLKPLLNKEGRPTSDREALDKIRNRKVPTTSAVPFSEKRERLALAARVADLCLSYRDFGKQLQVLKARQENGRMHAQFKLGPETFRAASSKTAKDTGLNFQNIAKPLRRIFVPDPGWTMFQADQERAESLCVAYLSGDEGYIKAHEGNSHVQVARMLFPDRPWTGDDKEDKGIAEAEKIYVPLKGEKSLYALSKMSQHSTNYLSTPYGLAVAAGIPVRLAEEVQARYFDAFPGIKRWQNEVIEQVKRYGQIIYPGGYRRRFFGRVWDVGTWREAIASVPQSIIAWVTHIAFVRLVRAEAAMPVQVLAHGHDAVIGQVKRGKEFNLNPFLESEWVINGRRMVIPWEIKWGNNWLEVS